MDYQPTNWKPRLGAGLNKFRKSSETTTHVYLTSEPDTVTQDGTAYTYERMWNMERGISAAYSRARAQDKRLGYVPLFTEPSAVIDATPIVRIRGSDDALLSFSSLTAGSVYYCASYPGTEVATAATDAILFDGDLYYATASGADIYRRPGITGTAALFLDDNYYTGFFVLNSTLYAIGRYGEDTNTAIFEIDTTLGTATYIATLSNVVSPHEIVPYLDRYLLIQQGTAVYVVDMEAATIEDVYVGTTDWYGQIIGAAVSGESMFQVEEIGKVRVRRSLHDSGDVFTFASSGVDASWFAIVGPYLFYIQAGVLRQMHFTSGAPYVLNVSGAVYQIPSGLEVGTIVEVFSVIGGSNAVSFPSGEILIDGTDVAGGNSRFTITQANYVVRMVKLSATRWKLLDGTDAGTNIGEPKCRATLFFNGVTADDKEATYVIASTVCTITLASHEYQPDHWVYIDFTSGGGTDGWFKIASVINANTFTVPYPAGGGTSGSCTLKRLKILGGKGVHSVSGLVSATSPMVANLKRRAPNAGDIVCTNLAGNADSVYANQLKEAGYTNIYRTPVSVGFWGIAGSSTQEHFNRTCVGFFW